METETEFDWHVCTDCQQSILRDDLPRTCRGCAARLKGPREQVDSCFFCRDHSMPFATVTSITNYEGIIRDLVVRMKSNNGQVTAIQMGRWLAACLTDNFFESNVKQCDYVTPMPSHWLRRLRRGFNVANLLVESICEFPQWNGKSCELLIANRKTRKQGTLTMPQRFENVKDCFRFSGKPDIQGKSILLVDDVMTSGATAIQAGKVLLDAGASKVHLGIVARGIGRQP